MEWQFYLLYTFWDGVGDKKARDYDVDLMQTWVPCLDLTLWSLEAG